MPYRSTDKTRSKKDARRTDMMQAAVRVFAEKGYYAATVRDIVAAANVSVGTFYFYFPDKETLFVHLYEETADFLLQSLQQAANSRRTLPEQVLATGEGEGVARASGSPSRFHEAGGDAADDGIAEQLPATDEVGPGRAHARSSPSWGR